MKLQKLDFDNLEKYRLENPIRILGGGTCIRTCCNTTSCGDWQDDEGNIDPPMQ